MMNMHNSCAKRAQLCINIEHGRKFQERVQMGTCGIAAVCNFCMASVKCMWMALVHMALIPNGIATL